MINRKVWDYTSVSNIPPNRRLIGVRFVNKLKGNGVYRARLVAKGYTQVPGVDHMDSFAPVITDVAYRIVLVLMLVNNYIGEIVDVETAF